MIKSFSVSDVSSQQFIDKVMQALAGRDLGKIATMSISGENMLMTFSKLGKSEVVFGITKEGAGFSCAHKSEKIAFTHKALRDGIESKLAQVLKSVGATVAEG